MSCILLDADLLLSLGFLKDSVFFIEENVHFDLDQKKIGFKNNEGMLIFGVPLKYLHELQNYFFEKTGNALNITILYP